MEGKKMRCHFSIIIENSWKILFVCFFAFLPSRGEMEEIAGEWAIVTAVFLLLLLAIFLFQLFRWRKTTVTLEEDALIWERATLNRKSLTIGIQNISSINLEQNIFELILGTSRLKIDTNSLSTAKTTDLSLLFKKETAQEIKRYLEHQMQRAENGDASEEESRTGAESYRGTEKENIKVQYTSDLSDLLMHSLYDFSLGGVLLAIFFLIGILGAVLDLLDVNLDAVTDLFWVSVMSVFLIVACLLSILRRFFTYYEFSAGRAEKRIILSYGLLKKKEYSLPVESINALVIKQTMAGRIFKRYSASIECIGVGDENNETAQLTLSLPYEEMIRRIGELLPEYELDALERSRPVPGKALWHKLCGSIYMLLIAVLTFTVIMIFAADEEGMGDAGIVAAGIFLFCLAWNLLWIFLSMRTEKMGMGEHFAALTKGSFGKKTVILQYRKIQYLEYTRSPLTRWTGLHKGNVHILSKTSILDSPMLSKDEIEQMKQRCMEW